MDRKRLRTLKTVLNSRASRRKEYLKDPQVQKILAEASLNVLKGNVELTKRQREKLKKHAKEVRLLACKRTPMKRRFVISQRGGFLAALAIPILKNFLGGLFKRY